MLNFEDVISNTTFLLAAADGNWLTGFSKSALSIIQVILGLGFVIFVHELGHFLAAKFFGVKCEKFYVGFDVPIKIGPIRLPASLGKFQWGETEYGIGIIPLGGYVKMLGQDDDPRRAEEEAARIRLEGQEGQSGKPMLDPRSFPAKPVYARMVIISAGVIMNLIFAVLMGAYAFRWGVPYQPTIVSSTTAGDPAWMQGLQPGDQLTQVGAMDEPDRKLWFEDMAENVAIAGLRDVDAPYPIKFLRGDEEKEVKTAGTRRHDPKGIRTMLGVAMVRSTQLRKDGDFLQYQFGRKNFDTFNLKGGDRIVAVDGNPLPVDPRLNQPLDYELSRRIDAKLDQPVTLQVERALEGKKDESEKVEVTLPPLKMRTLGVRFGGGKVSALQVDSLAEKAGVKVGDQIVQLNGKAIDDAYTLMLACGRLVGKEASLTLQRPDQTTYDFRWTVPELPLYGLGHGHVGMLGNELIGSGIVYDVSNTISGTVPGSAAEEVGLKPGDELTQVTFTPTAEMKKEFPKIFTKEFSEAITLGADNNAIWLMESIQLVPVGTSLKVHVLRDKKVHDANLTITESDEWNWPGRGLITEPAMLIHQSDSATEALSLGVRETKKRMRGVLTFLNLLVTARVPAKAVGGPGMIFYQASSAADQGITKLLMFLVMLSANLAILNFLPIPALDGGHMMFLIIEAARGKPVDEELQAKLTMFGVLALLALMGFVIVNDAMTLGRIFGR